MAEDSAETPGTIPPFGGMISASRSDVGALAFSSRWIREKDKSPDYAAYLGCMNWEIGRYLSGRSTSFSRKVKNAREMPQSIRRRGNSCPAEMPVKIICNSKRGSEMAVDPVRGGVFEEAFILNRREGGKKREKEK